MWILMNRAFFSIVQSRNNKNQFLVRARAERDIETIFPQADVLENAGTDYKYRTFLDKSIVLKAITQEMESIDYDNFKNSVPFHDFKRHEVYYDVWVALTQLQEREKETRENNTYVKEYNI